MNKVIDISLLINKNAPSMGGVFTYSDLAALIGTSEKTLLPRAIKQLESAGIIKKFMRGLYYVPTSIDLRSLSQRIAPKSYLSFETVLAKKMLIGPNPRYRVSAVTLGRSRTYKSSDFNVEHRGIQADLFFGFSMEDDFPSADAEKALLDCLYFYQKGRKLTFDPYSDVNIQLLDMIRLKQYLQRFNNPKFIQFVENALHIGE